MSDSSARWETARAIVTRPAVSEIELAGWTLSPYACVRKAALFRAMERGETVLEPMILPRLGDPSWSVRRQAMQALERCGTALCRDTVERIALSRDSVAVRSRAVYVLGHLADSRSIAVLERLLSDEAWDVRGLAAEQLRNFGRADVVPELRQLADHDPTGYVRLRARDSIDALTGVRRDEASAPDDLARRLLVSIAAATAIVLAVGMFFGPERFRRTASLMTVALAVAIGSLALATTIRATSRASGLTVACDDVFLSAMHREYGIDTGAAFSIVRNALAAAIPDRGAVARDTREFSECFDAERGQVDAARLLDELDRRRESRYALLTCDDLYVDPFHHTMGNGREGATVISALRLDPVWLAEGPGDAADRRIFEERLGKLVLHEVGHLYGLGHCDRPGCVMRAVETPEEFFRLDARFCPDCAARLSAIARWAKPLEAR